MCVVLPLLLGLGETSRCLLLLGRLAGGGSLPPFASSDTETGTGAVQVQDALHLLRQVLAQVLLHLGNALKLTEASHTNLTFGVSN